MCGDMVCQCWVSEQHDCSSLKANHPHCQTHTQSLLLKHACAHTDMDLQLCKHAHVCVVCVHTQRSRLADSLFAYQIHNHLVFSY